MTPGCTTQACDFRDNLASLQTAGYTVLGISPDAPAKLAEFRENDSLTFPLLSHPDLGVLKAYGAYGEKKLYGKTVTGVLRSTFVIDPDGKIVKPMYNVEATGHVAKLRRDLGLDSAPDCVSRCGRSPRAVQASLTPPVATAVGTNMCRVTGRRRLRGSRRAHVLRGVPPEHPHPRRLLRQCPGLPGARGGRVVELRRRPSGRQPRRLLSA